LDGNKIRVFSGRLKELAQNTIGGGKVKKMEGMVKIMNYIGKIIFQTNIKYICC
jgi:hypothetical protein